ncbi:serine/threonine protein kinase [Actinoallomurus spadix]|uniref:non-specific serine/threonine protein kinase n=1 Tax=Actinoallomurus spadix TaxID=79912 RepID=A0ABP3HCT1_9ACTN|nr:serine/threonine-protein kinase [Actinoallomurus spadix]MCO5985010.1 serine/threonine protein kinase [Actinoallomurus spadix]
MTVTFGPTTVLGDRYRLAERIAVGGQGEVWRAEDTALGRPVALKLLRGEYADSAEFRQRFRLEARNAAALSHPGIAQVFDYSEGRGDEPPYLVMEYVEGESLAATIARDAPMPPDRVLEVVASAAAALAVAHGAGLVHRDVKPGNLLVGRDGTIKITDFGIARAVDAIPLTRTGMLMGTPLYLAPEQATGKQATAAADLYALGVIAFEMLTGRPPYEGPATAVLVAHRDTPLPELPASVPSGLRDLIRALTAKDPAARPAGAALVADRAAWLRADPSVTVAAGTRVDGVTMPPAYPVGAATPGRTPVGVPPGHPPNGATQVLAVPPVADEPAGRRRALPLAAGGLAIALLAGGVGWFARPSSPHRPAATPSSSAPASSRPVSRPSPTVHRTPVHRQKVRTPPKRTKPRPQPPKRKKKPGHGKHH